MGFMGGCWAPLRRSVPNSRLVGAPFFIQEPELVVIRAESSSVRTDSFASFRGSRMFLHLATVERCSVYEYLFLFLKRRARP